MMKFILFILSTFLVSTNAINQHGRYQQQGHTNAVIVPTGKCSPDQTPNKRIVCYYRIEDEFRPYDLDPCLCTHIIYSFVAVKDNFAFIAGKKGDLKYLSALRTRNPSVKIIVSLRPTGTTFTLEDPKNITYPLPASNTLRHRFAKRIRDFLTRHSLDGIDLDYEYFKQESHSNNRRRDYLISIIQAISSSLRQSNEPNRPLLSLTTSRYPRHLADYYDFSELYKHVDFVNIPAFNFDQDGHTVIHPSKLHGISEMENMDAIMDLAIALGLPPHQLVIGVPTFGTLYRLANISQNTPGSSSVSWSDNKQQITTISHSKICDVRAKANWTLVREKDLTAPYIYLNDKWIGFDDEISIKLKAKYAILRQTGGLAFFHLNEDDPTGQCGLGPYPLVQSALSVFSKPIESININPIASPLYTNSSHAFFTSFLDIVAKHGMVERVVEDDDDDTLQTMPCTHTGYLRHTEDCTRFYRCLKFHQTDKETQKFQYNCPAGLVFDETYQICNWPSWSPSCMGSGEISPSTKQNVMCSKAGYFQDPDNCENFYYCSELGRTYLQSYEFKCPFELGFDEQKLQCNWKWLVKGCEYIPPEERIVKDLQQILAQASGSETAQSDPMDQIVPAASEVSELFEHMDDDFTDGGVGVTSMEDEFEERSDHDSNIQSLRAITSHLNPLNYFKADRLSSNNNDGQTGSRLQTLTKYMTKMYTRVRNTLWPVSTLETRSDRLNSAGWLNPFNHLIPKLKPFQRKPKTMPTTKKPKIKRVKSKKDRAFKLGKLPKFGKDKKGTPAPSRSGSSTSVKPELIGIDSAPYSLMFDPMPMFVEETVHIPQIVKPPTNFAYNPFVAPPKPMPTSTRPIKSANTRNHFNRKVPQRPQQSPTPKQMIPASSNMHVNVLNDYQVAGSFPVNTFSDQKPSTNVKPTNLSPTKKPVFTSYYYQQSSIKPPTIVKPNVNVRNKNTGSVTQKPTLPVHQFPDPYNQYRHSYGLPSVNIRYSYHNQNNNQNNNNNNSQPKPQQANRPKAKPKPKTTPKPLAVRQPSKPASVKIETTKFNFPNSAPILEHNADTQLEHFLRDRFIAKPVPLPLNTRPIGNRPPPPPLQPQPQPTQTTRVRQLASVATTLKPKPTIAAYPSIHDRPARPQTTKAPTIIATTPTNRFTNSFSSFIASDPFINEREKFFSNNFASFQPPPPPPPPQPPSPSPAPIEQPKPSKPIDMPKYPTGQSKPAINYKLTPITETLFEVTNKSSPLAPKTPLVDSTVRDPVINAVHNANRFEYVRSTQKPAIKYESYEWTTPTSLRNDKVNVNFNVMNAKDIVDEINKKKHLFDNNYQAYKPYDSALNKASFFPPIGDVFRNYNLPKPVNNANQGDLSMEQPAMDSFLGKTSTISPINIDEYDRSTNRPSWLDSSIPVEQPLPVPVNDTNEYIMLMLSNQMNGDQSDQHFKDILDGQNLGKNLAKLYNVEAQNGGQTLLALLPKFSNQANNRPFVYKGEDSLLKNMSDNDDILKLDISKPDSEILHSIFDRVKDQLSGTEELLPSIDDIGMPKIRHGNPFNQPPPPSPTIVNTERPTPISSTTDSGQPWYDNYDGIVNQPNYPVDEGIYDFHDQKLNRTLNAWYDEVNKNHFDVNRIPSQPNYEEPSSNSFGQKLSHGKVNGKESYAEVITTEKPIFYEEVLPDFTDLTYPETQNHHHRHHQTETNRRRPTTTIGTTTTTTTTVRPIEAIAKENTYYPDSTIHNLKSDKTGIPESACSRPGIFQHPNDCNKYYECYWDKHINKFTLQPFECPVKLAFDSRIIGCGSPNDPTVCVQY
ncbi:hypothetical protein BLOT_014566 [Blomia tropicalis]|nr:hypothetical protein BLOT_014566 [Blomia tropicalis]